MYELVKSGVEVSVNYIKKLATHNCINRTDSDFVFYCKADTEIPYTGKEILQMIEDGTL